MVDGIGYLKRRLTACQEVPSLDSWQALAEDAIGYAVACAESAGKPDERVVEAFDLLGGMWSWSEENGYFATGNTWPLQAGRLLREVVGRPAKSPERPAEAN